MPKVPLEKLLLEEKLINAVQNYPCIYDKKSKHYKDARKRENAFSEIAAKLKDKSPEELENLWNSLKSQYYAFLAKINLPTGSGNNKRPFFRHEGAMQFCKDSTTSSSNYSNLEGDVLEEDTICAVEDSQTLQGESSATNTKEPQSISSNAAAQEQHSAGNQKRAETVNQVRKRKLDPFEVKLLEVVGGSENEDEFDLFGKSIAIKLRRVHEKHPVEATRLESKILQMILQYEDSIIKL